jgi:hypothetical protein
VDSGCAEVAEPDELVIDLREGEPSDRGVKPPSPYGYDAVMPKSWRSATNTGAVPHRREQPCKSEVALPRRFRLKQRFPPLQRIVHYGPVNGQQVAVKLTVAQSILLHSTGIENPMRDLDGRLRDSDHLQLLTDTFGRDRRWLGSQINRTADTLEGAKREWHKSIVARNRYGFAVNDSYLVLLEYRSPERDLRQRSFGIAYKRIVVGYQIELDDVDRHPRQQHHAGIW